MKLSICMILSKIIKKHLDNLDGRNHRFTQLQIQTNDNFDAQIEGFKEICRGLCRG